MAIDRERAELRRLVAGQGWRLRPGSRDGLYNLHDTHGHLEAEDLTAQELRLLCSGQIGLGQVRQPAAAATGGFTRRG